MDSGGRWIEYGPGGKLQPGDQRFFKAVGKRTPLFVPTEAVAWVCNPKDNACGCASLVVVVDGKEAPPTST